LSTWFPQCFRIGARALVGFAAKSVYRHYAEPFRPSNRTLCEALAVPHERPARIEQTSLFDLRPAQVIM
jgi:hypothetical protein